MIAVHAAVFWAGLALAAPMPAVGPMKPYRTPPRTEWKLANGLKVLLVNDRRLPLVTAKLAVRSGGATFSAADAGTAEALAELLTDGTTRRDSKAIADAADAYGGAISAEAGPDDIVLGSYCLSGFADRMFALMAETARAPSFPTAEVELRRKNMSEELRINRSEPDFLAGVAFYKKLFGRHPYAVTAPTDASIERITRARLIKAHRRLFTPRNAVLVIVGDIAPERAKALLQAHFGSWRGPLGPAAAPAVPTLARKRRVYIVDRPGSVQTSLILGNIAMREDHPDYFNYLVANQVLGGSFGSRLVQDIRESRGYTYRIGSRVETRLTTGIFRVRTPVRNEVVAPALAAILEHLERIRDKQVSGEELDKAKNYLAGSFARNLETQDGLAGALLHVQLRRLPPDYLDTYVRKVQAVKAADVERAAATFIRPSELVIVAVGDSVQIKEPLRRFSEGPVVSVDDNGD
jgi:zinc protease